ncbi:MAG: 50S ribosomal protein L11 methyltransferase [Halioglobus sp.]|nr:50S ribosomal protein L11 methyltransferase [Halioglobus sp.]
MDSLQQHLAGIIPGARLEPQRLPGSPAIELMLLNTDYPQGSLQPEQVRRVMDNPLYWVFCWASGQVLAQLLLAEPERVAGRRVLDFGCGSGVVAIAAKLAGAAEVIACDIDPLALSATAVNARHNGVELTLSGDYHAVAGSLDSILVADVLYDRGNFPWLARFAERAGEVLIADSRVKDFHFPPYRQVGRQASCTLPDLDESAEFRDVRLYRAGGGA